MSEWQDIKSAPTDGSKVLAGAITPMSIGGEPLYPMQSRFLGGKWCADFGSRGAERWVSYDPQPTHWKPTQQEPQMYDRDPQTIHRHKTRGTEYVLIGYGKMQAEGWHENDPRGGHDDHVTVDMREVAIYRSATDPTEIWVRPREDFEDGRFEIVTRHV